MFSFVCMKKFDRCQKEYGVTDDILFDAQRILTLDPYAGDLIPGTGGAWKLRCCSDDRGKRGSFRFIYTIRKDKSIIYFLLVYPKNKQTNLTKEQTKEVREMINNIMLEDLFLEVSSMGFFDDLMESLNEVKEYEKGNLDCRELETLGAEEISKLAIAESNTMLTAHIVKPNGEHCIISTDVYDSDSELVEDYESNGYRVISVLHE